ncbi:MAG TPA: aldo/keto reductase, partial [Thermoleophilia bacterium]|nr:aldo/keto reductase [Thermoleophilia bacterium]
AGLERNLAQIDALRAVAGDRGASVGQLALAWLLAQGSDVVPLPGSRDPDRVAENAAAAEIKLTDTELRRVEEVAPRAGWAGDRTSFAVPVTSRGA